MVTRKWKIGAAAGTAVLATAVTVALIAVIRSDSSSAFEGGPSAEDVKALLDDERAANGVDAMYEDSLYELRLGYPAERWRITLGDSPEPHRIQLQTTGEFAPTESSGMGIQPSAEITIQPYLSESVSDARCDAPEESKVGGYPAFICAYSYGNSYKNFEPTPQEWSVISVTLMLDNGPVYVSAAVLKPLGESDPSALLDALRSLGSDVMEIIKSIEIDGQTPS